MEGEKIRQFLPLLALAILALGVSAQGKEPIYETTLQELGHENFRVERPEKTGCVEVNFLFPEELFKEPQLYPIFSLNIMFSPTTKGDAKATLKINDINITTFGAAKAKCTETNCWKRIFVGKELLQADGQNTAEICLQTSNTITSLELDAGSVIGLYEIPVISVSTLPEKYEMTAGENLEITVRAENTGSREAIVQLNRAREIASDKNAYRVVAGETGWQGTIPAGDKKEIIYSIKPTIIGGFSLPPAILSFQNIFGEEETVIASPVVVLVKLPEQPIEAEIIKKEEVGTTGSESTVTIVLRNKTDQSIENVVVAIETGAVVYGGAEKTVALAPRQTKNIQFALTAEKEGTYTIGCSVKYEVAGLRAVECGKQEMVFMKPEIPAWLIFGIVFLAIAAGIYAYIHYSK